VGASREAVGTVDNANAETAPKCMLNASLRDVTNMLVEVVNCEGSVRACGYRRVMRAQPGLALDHAYDKEGGSMRRVSLLVASAIALAALALVPAAAFASGVPAAKTFIEGTVTHLGAPVSGATVTVVCNGVTQTGVTNGHGGYKFQDSQSNWPDGATVTATATNGSLTGSNTGTVNRRNAQINMAVVDVSAVPEFGAIAGVSALLLGAVAFVFIRRRRLAVAR